MPETTAEDIVKLYSSNRTNASLAVTSGIDANPQQAARAMELSRSSGVDGSIIYDDMDEFERNYKAQMAGAIVRNNPQLTEFVRSNPMVPKLINNDYATLDGISQKLELFGLPMKVLRLPEAIGKLMLPDDHDPLERFKEGGPLGNWLLQDPTARNDYRLLSSIVTGLPPVAAIELAFRGLGGIMNTAADMAYNLGASAAVQGISSPRIPGLEQYMPNFGNAGLLRDLASGTQFAGMMGRPHDHLGPAIAEHNTRLARETDNASVALWLSNDRKPPQGVLPEYDDFLLGRNTKDVESLGDIIGDAQKADLRQHDADLLASYVRQHTDSNIGISAEGIAALYGDKVPMPDDGLLGWIPGLAEQLEAAKRSGDDIHVPLADFAAKVEPEVFKALADDLRIRPDGITKREAEVDKERSAAIPPPIPLLEAVPATRAAYGLEPLLSVGDRNIRMEKRPTEMKADVFGADQWRLLDEQGNKVGHLELTPHGDRLYVDVVQGLNGLGARDFGPALMRSLLRQIKEQYPDAKEIGGFRISGARERAGSEKEAWIKLDKDWNTVDNWNEFGHMLEGGQWETYSPNIKAYIKPDFNRLEEHQQLTKIISDELAHIVPKKVSVQSAESIRISGAIEGQRIGEDFNAGGAYIRRRDSYPIILFALDSPDSLGSARHEAIHHLRQYGFFNEGEWQTLEAQALAGGWLTKYGIDRRYPEANPSLKLEEAIAEAYRDWASGTKAPTPEIHGLFERMKAFFAAIKERISQLLGKDATWEDVFQKVDTGEVGAREGTKPLDPRAFDEKLNVEQLRKAANDNYLTEEERRLVEDHVHNLQDEDMARQSSERVRAAQTDADRQKIQDVINKILAHDNALDDKLSVEPPAEPSRIFERANALGMTIEQYKRYDKLIEQRHAEDIAASERRVDQAQRRTQTKEWKANRAEVRKQVAEDINLRPDIAADNYFADGILYGQKVDRAKLGTDFLTEQQRASLPRDYYNKAGLNPDDVAPLFGFPDGQTLVQHLTGLSEVRRQSGMRPIEFKRRVIDIETDRQMHQKYGVLENNIMDAVKEQVVSETEVNRVHEETLYYAVKAGEATPLDKSAVQRMVDSEFEQSKAVNVSSDRYLAAVRRADTAIQNAQLKQDWAGAFREAQRKSYAMQLARDAVQFENGTMAKFDKLSAQFSAPFDPKKSRVDADYSIAARQILSRVDRPYGMSIQGLDKALNEWGYTGLDDFVKKQESLYSIAGVEFPIADFLLDPNFRKRVEDMSVAEFRGLTQSIEFLNKFGRDVERVNIEGAAFERKEWVQKANAQLVAKFPSQDFGATGAPGLARTYLMSLTNLETLFARFDGRDPEGMFTKMFSYPATAAANFKDALGKEFARAYKEAGELKDPKKKLVSPLIDPLTGAPLTDFRREHMATIIANMGNDYNWRVFTQGWKIDKDVLWKWVEQNSLPEDFTRAQAVGKLFDRGKDKSDVVYKHMYGVSPEDIQVRPFTMHGMQFEGWYHPITYDPIRSKLSLIQADGPESPHSNFWPSTSNAYTKRRTGNVDVISLSQDMVPIKMNQMLHDIAFREFVHNTAKITRDRNFRDGVTKSYGPEYVEAIDTWLERIAGNASYNGTAMSMASRLSNQMRQNVISTYIAFNLTTMQKHGVTAFVMSGKEVGYSKIAKITAEVAVDSFYHATMDLFGKGQGLGDSLWQFVRKNSEEIQRRDRNFAETMMGQHDLLLDRPTLRNKIVDWGSKGVAFSDMLSAVPLWLAKYRDVLHETADVGKATEQADRAVRRAHGSTAITNQPMIVSNSNALSPWLTSIYGFFGTNMQRRIEIAHDINDAYKLGRGGDIKQAAKMAPGIMSSIFTYVIWPGIVEEMVSSQFYDDKSKGGLLGHVLAFTLGTAASTFIGIRDLAYGLVHGHDPQAGLASSPLHDVNQLIRDVKKDRPFDKHNAGKLVQDAITVFGDATGKGPKHVGTAARYGIDVWSGEQKPKGDIANIYRGVVSGHQEKGHN